MAKARDHTRESKAMALAILLIGSLLLYALLASPLYIFRERIFARIDYIVLVVGPFLYVTWLQFSLTRSAAKRIKALPESAD